jgi:hypothetical protein
VGGKFRKRPPTRLVSLAVGTLSLPTPTRGEVKQVAHHDGRAIRRWQMRPGNCRICGRPNVFAKQNIGEAR